jgi:hypothetical protein
MYQMRSPERQRHAGLETATPGAGDAAAMTNDRDTQQKIAGEIYTAGASGKFSGCQFFGTIEGAGRFTKVRALRWPETAF